MKIISIFLVLSCLVIVALCQNNVRSIDGTNNNINNPTWGISGAPLLRNIPYTYDDGFQSPTGGLNSRLLSPRLISNVIIGRKSEYTIPADLETTDLLTFWAQFIDHDITFSLDTKDATGVCNFFNINIPKGDPFFDSASLGGQTMQFCRLAPVPGTGTNASNPLNVPNIITAYVDGSGVYGYTTARATALRTFTGGLMKTSKGIDGDFLPINNDGKGNTLIDMANAAAKFPVTELYAGGDLRANENPVLLSLHTLMVREHNRRARLLPSSMSDEAIYQQARKMVIASIQKITYTDFLPTVLGIPFPAYPGYNLSANAGVTAFFSTSAYRFGHDQLNNVILRLDPLGNSITQGSVLLRDIFFDIPSFNVCGPSPYLRGAAVHPQRLIDTVIEDDVRIFLYGGGPSTAFDLPARNMQRARDVGLGFYNDARKAYGLPTCTTFDCVTNDTNLVTLLNNLYGTNNVSFLDSFIGGLMEPKANKKAKLGVLFSTAIIEQFSRMRNGDRFWYENPGVLTSAELKEIQTTSLGDIIKRNTDSKLVPASVFNRQNVAPEAIYNPPNNTPWIIGIIIVTIVAAILLVVVIGLCFAKSSGGSGGRRVEDNQLYDKLMTDK